MIHSLVFGHGTMFNGCARDIKLWEKGMLPDMPGLSCIKDVYAVVKTTYTASGLLKLVGSIREQFLSQLSKAKKLFSTEVPVDFI